MVSKSDKVPLGMRERGLVVRNGTNRVEYETCLLRRVGLLAIVKPPLDSVSCGRVVTLVWLPSDMNEALADGLVLNVVREKLARLLCHAEEGVLIFFDLGFEVRQARLIVREDPGEVRLLSRNLPFLLLNHDRVSVICGCFAIYGDMETYECPDWIFWSIFDP